MVSSAWRLLDEGGFLLYATCALSPKENDEIISRLAKKFSDAEIQSKDFMENVFKKNLAGMESKKIAASVQAREEDGGAYRAWSPDTAGLIERIWTAVFFAREKMCPKS